MKMPPQRTYPDISDLLVAKVSARRARAKRSLGEKIDILEAMRERVAPIRKARIARKAASPT